MPWQAENRLENQENTRAENGVEPIFQDFESRSNIVGLYDLLLKIAKRNPKLWAKINEAVHQ